MQEVIYAKLKRVSGAFVRSASIFLGLIFDESDERNLRDHTLLLLSHQMKSWLQDIPDSLESSNPKASNVLMVLYRQNAFVTDIHTL